MGIDPKQPVQNTAIAHVKTGRFNQGNTPLPSQEMDHNKQVLYG